MEALLISKMHSILPTYKSKGRLHMLKTVLERLDGYFPQTFLMLW